MQSGVKKPAIWPLLLILAGTGLAYLPTLRYGFVYDDRYQILRNPRIQSWRYFGSYFLHHVWIHQSPDGSYYRPLFLVWLRLNHWVFGYHPLGWHATTVLLHLAAVWLVWELLSRTLETSLGAGLGTAIFALHPSHLESVAWVSGLTDPLLALPLIGSVLCWVRYRQDQRPLFLYGSYGLTVAALLAKETAMLIPALIFLYTLAFSKEQKLSSRFHEAWRAFAPYLFIFAAFWFTRALLLRKEGLPFSRGGRDLIANVVPLLWFYAKHLSGLSPVAIYYDFTPLPWSWPAAALGLLGLAGLVSIAWLALKRSPQLLIAFAWTILPIAIASSAVTVFILGNDCVHDRYLYLATIGLGIALGHCVERLHSSRVRVFGKPAAQVIAAAAILSVLVFATLGQMSQWHDDLALFARSAEVAPNNPVAQKQYAYQLHLLDRENDAQRAYERVLQLNPNDADSTFALALFAYQHDRWDETVNYCERTIKISPYGYIGCYRFETISLMNLGRTQEAEKLARRAIACFPQAVRQHLILGELLEREGDVERARQEFLQELNLGESGEAREELAKLRR